MPNEIAAKLRQQYGCKCADAQNARFAQRTVVCYDIILGSSWGGVLVTLQFLDVELPNGLTIV